MSLYIMGYFVENLQSVATHAHPDEIQQRGAVLRSGSHYERQRWLRLQPDGAMSRRSRPHRLVGCEGSRSQLTVEPVVSYGQDAALGILGRAYANHRLASVGCA